MKRINNNISITVFGIIILIVLILNSCGRNITYIEETDYTGKVYLKSIKCYSSTLDLRLKEISAYDTQQDTFIYRSHNDLSLYLDVKVTNNSDSTIVFNTDRGEYDSNNFKWIFNLKGKKDTVFFYSFDKNSKYLIKAKDSVKVSLYSYFYNFERLFGKQKDYTQDMLDLLSDFRLVYNDGEKEICVSQNSNIKIVVHNDKSKWSFWGNGSK